MFPKSLIEINAEIAELTARADSMRENYKQLKSKSWDIYLEIRKLQLVLDHAPRHKVATRMKIKIITMENERIPLEANADFAKAMARRVDNRIHRLWQMARDMERVGM